MIELKKFKSAKGSLTDDEARELLNKHSQLKIREMYSNPTIGGKPIPVPQPEEEKLACAQLKPRRPFENDDSGFKF